MSRVCFYSITTLIEKLMLQTSWYIYVACPFNASFSTTHFQKQNDLHTLDKEKNETLTQFFKVFYTIIIERVNRTVSTGRALYTLA